EPVSTTIDVPGRSRRSRRVASIPSSTGMLMSISTTSGCSSRARSIACCPSFAVPTTSIRSSGERMASSGRLKRRWSSAIRTFTGSKFVEVDRNKRSRVCRSLQGRYGAQMTDDVRERIQKLLVTGDNRLKQGVEPAKVRESYERALALAREAGLEER